MKKILNKAVVFIMIIAAVTLSVPDLSGVADVEVQAASIRLDYNRVTVTEQTSFKLKILGTSKKVKWSSSNKKIAKVTQKGKVTAKKKGKCTITAKVSGKKYKCKVTVTKRKNVSEPASSKKAFTSATLNVSTLKLDVTRVKYYSDGSPYLSGSKGTYKLAMLNTSKKVTWSSSNKKIATVSKKGKVKAKKKGKCTITAKVNGKKYKCKVTITDYQDPIKIIKQKSAYDMLNLVNRDRVAAKTKPLKMKASLNKVANIRAKELAKSFSHTRPDGTSFQTAYKDAGVKTGRFMGENVAFAEDKVPYMDKLVEVSYKNFYNSKAHKAAMENTAYEYVGVGYIDVGGNRTDAFGNLFIKTYWALEFYTE